MHLSTWIRRVSILLVSSTWAVVSWLAPSWRKGGMFNVAPRSASKSSMLKPRSAMMLSPGSTRLRKPQCSVMCRSDVRPPQIWETHTTVHLWSPVLSVHGSNPKSSTLWVFGKTEERNTRLRIRSDRASCNDARLRHAPKWKWSKQKHARPWGRKKNCCDVP